MHHKKLDRLLRSTLNYYKKDLLFFFTLYKMGGKKIDFNDKKKSTKRLPQKQKAI